MYYWIAYTEVAEGDGEIAVDEAQCEEEGNGEEIAMSDVGEEIVQEIPVE